MYTRVALTLRLQELLAPPRQPLSDLGMSAVSWALQPLSLRDPYSLPWPPAQIRNLWEPLTASGAALGGHWSVRVTCLGRRCDWLGGGAHAGRCVARARAGGRCTALSAGPRSLADAARTARLGRPRGGAGPRSTRVCVDRRGSRLGRLRATSLHPGPANSETEQRRGSPGRGRGVERHSGSAAGACALRAAPRRSSPGRR